MYIYIYPSRKLYLLLFSIFYGPFSVYAAKQKVYRDKYIGIFAKFPI